MPSSGISWNIQRVKSLVLSRYTRDPLSEFLYLEKYKWQVEYSMVYYERALQNYFKNHGIENTAANTIDATFGCNIVEYTTDILYSDWL